MGLRVNLRQGRNELYFSKRSRDDLSIRATISSFERPCITIECANQVEIDIDSGAHLDMLLEALAQHDRYQHVFKPEWLTVLHGEYRRADEFRRKNDQTPIQGSQGTSFPEVPAENCS